MKIITNDSLITRNNRLGFWASLISPLCLAFGVSNLVSNPERTIFSVLLIFAGLIIFYFGISFRKWGRETHIFFDQALKKFGKEYTLYHFHTPASHLLVGPAGIWILIPRHVEGSISFNSKRGKWKVRKFTLVKKFIALFSEGIGNPALEIIREADDLDRYLQTRWEDERQPLINAAVIFIDPNTEIISDDYPVPTIKLAKLRDFIRTQENKNNIPLSLIKKFNALFIK